MHVCMKLQIKNLIVLTCQSMGDNLQEFRQLFQRGALFQRSSRKEHVQMNIHLVDVNPER